MSRQPASCLLECSTLLKIGAAPSFLIQCALIAQSYSPYLKRYYEKIKNRSGTGKAIVALARNHRRN
jgi:hypothetical protein